MLGKHVDNRYAVKFCCLDSIVPKEHLLRKIEKAIDFNRIYEIVEGHYCNDNGRPSVDPVVLIKMSLIQHIYGIKSLRQTVKEIDMNIAYRWFIGYDVDTPIPHFATISYAFTTRFPSDIFEKIFAWILETAVAKGFVNAGTIFIDATHIKANANRKKQRKQLALKTARTYDEKLRAEINAERKCNSKKPLKVKDKLALKNTVKSTTDPDCGLFHKGEHKVEFAYSAHVACDENNFVLDCEVTAGNVHDSVVFDDVYNSVIVKFPEIESVAVDAGYKTPWICKQVIDSGRNISAPYKRPMTKRGFFKSYEYVYDDYYNCIICPYNQVLPYSITNKDGYREFKSNPHVCCNCPYLSKCTESKNHQKVVTKHIWDDYIDNAEDFRHSPEGKYTYSLRSQTIERVFADAKEKHGMRYTLIRGLTRVKNWVRLKFAAMNLKKLALWAW